MNRRMMAMLTLGSLSGLAGCASGPAGPPQAGAPAAAGLRVTGTLSYRQRIALPPDSEVIVQLRDVSRADAGAVVLAEQRFKTRSQVPLPYELVVPPARMDPRLRYAVAARIEHAGKLLFINDKVYPVLTQGHGNRADLMLHMVSRP